MLANYSQEHKLQAAGLPCTVWLFLCSTLSTDKKLVSGSLLISQHTFSFLSIPAGIPIVFMQQKVVTFAAGYVPPQMSTHQSPSPPPASSHSDDFDTNGLQQSPLQGPSPPADPPSESQDQPHQQATPSLQQLGASQESRAVSGSFSSLSVERIRVSSGSGGGLPDGIGMRPHHLQVSRATAVSAWSF